jgi:hypothetical protein
MSHRTMKSLARFAVATSVLCAAVVTGFATPASAVTEVLLIGRRSNEAFTCTVSTTHGLYSGPAMGFYQADNGCGTRLWLHQYGDGSGWAYCIGPHVDKGIPAQYQFPAQALVSANTAAC